MKVAMINMPYGSLYRPSIGIALLQSALKQRDFECETFYFNQLFASMVGPEAYDHLSEKSIVPTAALAGEWIFSESLYGTDNYEAYRDYFEHTYFRKLDESQQAGRMRVYDLLLRMRSSVEAFMERALQSADWSQYDVIGFTTVFEQNVAALSLAKRIKAQHPRPLIILGGANVEGEMGLGLMEMFPFLDAVCSGEGDISFISFMEQLRERRDPAACRVQGIHLRQQREEVPALSADFSQLSDQQEEVPLYSSSVHDMNALPYPDYDDYFRQFMDYGLHRGEFAPRFLFESSRGCWWGAKSHCLFCGLNGSNMSYRSKTADRALSELLYLREKYSAYTNKAAAVDNIIDMEYFNDFLPVIRDMDLDLDMFYETKANLTKEKVKLFKDAGFHYVQPGIESLITSVLRLMRKGVSMMQNVQLLKWCREFGVTPLWNFLYGFPGENEQEYLEVPEMIRALTHLDPPGGVSPIRLDRFSPYYNNAAEYGIANVRPMRAYELVYQQASREQLMRIAYHFDFDYASGQNYASYTGGLDQEIRRWKQEYKKSEFFSVDQGDRLILVDLRQIDGNEPFVVLTGLEKILYQHCDNVRSYKTMYEYLSQLGQPFTEAGVQAILNRFIERKWMITEKGIYLSLAIPLGHYTPKKDGLEQLAKLMEEKQIVAV